MAEHSSLEGLRVLVVEDETLVAMLLEDMLADHGCEVAATVSRIAQALEAIAHEELQVDAAILDVNLAGEPSFPIAQALAEKGVPFVFATGYGSGGLPETWRDRPTLQKPFSHDEVGRMLALAVGR
jgi:CheY-like chemotaxis protein